MVEACNASYMGGDDDPEGLSPGKKFERLLYQQMAGHYNSHLSFPVTKEENMRSQSRPTLGIKEDRPYLKNNQHQKGLLGARVKWYSICLPSSKL
jgi:hypothetical protein